MATFAVYFVGLLIGFILAWCGLVYFALPFIGCNI